MIQVNGKEANEALGMTVSAYLEKAGYIASHIAIAYNDYILKRENFDSKIIEDGDVIEIVNFVGGGC